MKDKITIVDYGMGNLFSVEKKIKSLGLNPVVSSRKEDIDNTDKIILPGVGHFGKAIESLKELDLMDCLNKAVLIDKKPTLGICLGMQLMTKKSEEGGVEGLGWIDAIVKRFKVKDMLKHKVPHMGWNTVSMKKKSILFNQITNNAEFYFVHSYFVKCQKEEDILTTTTYEEEFTSSFQKDNIFGVQYHPEKSHDMGKQMFQNFVHL